MISIENRDVIHKNLFNKRYLFMFFKLLILKKDCARILDSQKQNVR